MKLSTIIENVFIAAMAAIATMLAAIVISSSSGGKLGFGSAFFVIFIGPFIALCFKSLTESWLKISDAKGD